MFTRIFLALILTFTFSGPAFGSDLVGTWECVDKAGVRAGTSEHHGHEGDKWLTDETPPFHLTITEVSPDGRAFHGEWCSEKKCEDLVGVVRIDRSLLFVDEDGYFDGVLLGDGMEICYREADEEFRIAMCGMYKKVE